MEVVIPTIPSMDFGLHGRRSSPPSISAPSSPKHLGDDQYYFSLSAPTSPSRIPEFYREYEEFCRIREEQEDNSKTSSSSVVGVPFDWEEKPGTPKSYQVASEISEFAFDFSEEMEKASRSAEELFDGGKIKPLKPPPRLQEFTSFNNSLSPPKSSSPIRKRIIQTAFSPKQRKPSDHDPAKERGRGRVQTLPSSSSGRRATRSLSPLRVSEFSSLEEQEKANQNSNSTSKSALATTSSSSSSSSIFGRWKFKDLLLFRSASEGRASAKDPLKKYASLLKKQEEVKHSSFRSTDSFGSGSGSSKRRSQVSAHELHYTKNKAASEDMKKKTFLPYKQGILGLAFGPAVNVIAHGLGSSFTKN